MIKPIPITAEQSRAARQQLGLTQAQVIEQGNITSYKLKQFESGRFTPDTAFLDALRNFYVEQGADLDEKPVSGEKIVKSVSRMCFYVADAITEDQLEAALKRLDATDDRVAELLPQAVEESWTSAYGEGTEDALREVYQRLAEGYLLFRMLQGRNIIEPRKPSDEAKTIADLLAQYQSQDFLSILETAIGKASPSPAKALPSLTAIEE